MIEIIPAIDLIGGKCVRLVQGDYDQKKEYDHDPVELALMFESIGIRRLHIVDLDGARLKKPVNLQVLREVAQATKLDIDWGGGIAAAEDLQQVFDAGACMAVIGSLAVSDPDLVKSWIEKYGPEKIILGADVKNGMIAVNAWTETSRFTVRDFMKQYLRAGARQFLCTDVEKDGMLQGSSIELYMELLDEMPELKLIASGGVSSRDEIINLDKAGLFGVIIGKALYEGRLKVSELSMFI